MGALSVVQPLMVCGLLFALVLRQRNGKQVSHREIAWGAVLTGCLAGFLLLAGTAHQPASPEPPDRVPAVAAAVAGLIWRSRVCCWVAGFGTVVARRRFWVLRSVASTHLLPPC